MTPTPAVSAKEKAREAIKAAIRRGCADELNGRSCGDIVVKGCEAAEYVHPEDAAEMFVECIADEVLAALSTEGEAEPVAWPKDPETGLNDLSLPTLLRMTRADASAPAGVKVKPLEWRAHPGDWWSAQSILGEYAHGNAGWYGPDGSVHGARGKEACQAAAQADYESRIRSSLQPDTQAVDSSGSVTLTREQIDGLLRAAYPLATASERAGVLKAALLPAPAQAEASPADKKGHRLTEAEKAWRARPAPDTQTAASAPAQAEALPAGVGVERIVEAMEDEPFWQDAGLAGTTQQDQRIRHYAEVAVRALSSAPAQEGRS